MDDDKTYDTKDRLGEKLDEETKNKVRKFILENHKGIVDVLNDMHSDLLLVLKTNNYLRAIDRRLGSPNNTFNSINEITWQVYSE